MPERENRMANLRKTAGFLLPLTKLCLLKACHVHAPVSKYLKSSPKAGCKVAGFVNKYVDSLQLAI